MSKARTARVAWAVAAAFAALSIALAMVVVFQQNPSVERRLTAVENTVDTRLESVEARLETLEARQREQTDLIAELREELARKEVITRDPDPPGDRRPRVTGEVVSLAGDLAESVTDTLPV